MVAKDKMLTAKNQALKEARRQERVVLQKLTKVKQDVGQALKKTKKLIEQKTEVEKQLQLREQELQFLRQKAKDSQQFLSIIQNRDEEVRVLQHRLDSVMSELASKRKEIQDLRDNLRWAIAELDEKSALVQEQEKSNGDLKIRLERERECVDQLVMQLTSDNTSRGQCIKETEVMDSVYKFSTIVMTHSHEHVCIQADNSFPFPSCTF